MSEYMVDLKERTEKLPALSKMIDGVYNGVTQYKAGEGTVLGFPLHNEADVAVQRVFISEGTCFDLHEHENREWILVFDGKLSFTVADDSFELGVADYVCIEIGQEHRAVALKDTWYICVSIPAAEGYPSGGEQTR